MGDTAKGWEGEMVCAWLERRIAAARVDQIAADRKGYSAHDDYDKAAAEEWACRAVQAAARKGDQATVAARLKDLWGKTTIRPPAPTTTAASNATSAPTSGSWRR